MSDPGMLAEQGDTLSPGLHNTRNLLEEVSTALAQGKAPRAGRHLQSAARELTLLADHSGAAEALRLAALLELRRGKPDQALRAARSAERLIRGVAAGPECAPVLDLLSRLYSMVGEHNQAVRIAERWRAEGSVGSPVADRRLSLALWASGDVSAAFQILESVDGDSGGTVESTFALLLAQMLIRIGCPTAAMASSTRILKNGLSPREECEAQETRGWAGLCLGQWDLSVRSFRRSARLTADLQDPRRDAEIAVALAVSELERIVQRGGDVERAKGRLDRRIGKAERLGLHHLSGATAENIPMHPSALGSPNVKAAAQCLVSLARTSQSLSLVDACCDEVERLRCLPDGTSPYAFTRVPPMSLE